MTDNLQQHFEDIASALPPHTAIQRQLFERSATWTTPAGTWRIRLAFGNGLSISGPGLLMNPRGTSLPIVSLIVSTLRLHNAIAPAEDDIGSLLADGWALIATADNWGVRADGWREAAEKWRDRFHSHLGLPKPEPIIDRDVQPRTSERNDEQRIADAVSRSEPA